MSFSLLHSNYSPIFSVAETHISSTSSEVTSHSERVLTTTTTTATTTAKTRATAAATTTAATEATYTTFVSSAIVVLRSDDNADHLNGVQEIHLGEITSEDNAAEPDNEMGLLWLPYVVFTVVLLILIALSFVRFHCQRGDQYRRRRSELEEKVPPLVNDRSVLAASYQPNGVSTTAAKPPFCEVPEHMVLFLQFTETESPSGAGSGSQDEQWTTSNRPSSGRRVFGFKAQSKVPSVEAAIADAKAVGGRPRRVTCHRRPLTFTFNINGSMVDIRCSDEERTKTFHLSTGETGNDAPEISGTSGDRFCATTGAYDDDDDLQTRCGDYRKMPRAATATATTTTTLSSSSSRRSSSNKTQGCIRGGGGGGRCEVTGICPHQKVFVYSMTTETNDLHQNSSADEALFLLQPMRS